MSFRSGRVSFVRFAVEGDAPQTCDETALATLAEHAFRARSIGAPDEIEAGWITGEHLFDTQFTYDKCGFGDKMLFALRLDTNKPPADVKQAYKRIQELALASANDNPTGFLSKREKREAAELAERQLNEELAAGKYRKSKAIPVLWDLSRGEMFCAGGSTRIVEELSSLMRQCFEVSLIPKSAGGIAHQMMESSGRQRDFEDLRPTAFTRAPSEAGDGDAEDGPRDSKIPFCPWAFAAGDGKDWLGNEMLIWLWRLIEREEGLIDLNINGRSESIAVLIDRTLEMDCAWEVRGKQTLRGTGPTRLVEAGDALATGKWPRKLGLTVADTGSGEQWELSLQGDHWSISGAALPQDEEAASPRDVIEQRLASTRRLADLLDGIYTKFLTLRTGDGWPSAQRGLTQWIIDRRKAAGERMAAATNTPAAATAAP